MVAMPPIISASSSLRVMRGMYGLINSGASVWPMKMFAAVASVSLPLVRMALCITQAAA